MEFTADYVWALAVEADRINNGYLKEEQWQEVEGRMTKTMEANKKMVKAWLMANKPASEEDIEQGRVVRNYFNGFLLKELSGKINDFERQALRIAQMDEFTGRHLLEFAIISCLPSTMRRDQQRMDTVREILASTQLQGEPGDKVQGEITVLSSRYSQEYNKYRIQAKMVDSFVDFWYNSNLNAGDRVSIKAKIKSVRGDKTTQLNFVKRG